jgi:hypothetical protein
MAEKNSASKIADTEDYVRYGINQTTIFVMSS